MPADSVVRARIDERTKKEASAVLKAMGLTVSDAVRLMMLRIANDKELPFNPLIPNQETIEALEASRRRETTSVASMDELFASLDAED